MILVTNTILNKQPRKKNQMNTTKKIGEIWKSIIDGSINAWERECELLEQGYERMDDRFNLGRKVCRYRLLVQKRKES
jgi:translation elongation factor EF-Ts